MISKFRLWSTSGALLLCAIPVAGFSATISYGINYMVFATDAGATGKCDSDPGAPSHGKFALSRYNKPEVRSEVLEQFKAQRASGFETLRTIVELVPGDNPSGDFVSEDKIDDPVLNEVRSFTGDVRDAGFKQFILGFGTLGAAAPNCKKKEWGDCFDPKTIAVTVEAERRIIQAASSIDGVSLRLDLMNETCPSDSGPKSANTFRADLIRAVAKMHVASFSKIPATVSCQIERSGDGLATVRQLFHDSGDHVGYFDVHAYPGPTRIEAKALQQAAKSLKGVEWPVIVGEISYGDPDYRRYVTDSYRASFHKDPPEILFWPRHGSSKCHFQLPLPYTLKGAMAEK